MWPAPCPTLISVQASRSTSKISDDGFCQQAFKERAQDQFGSGWVWLAVDRSDYDVDPIDPEALVIIALPNQVAIQIMFANPWSGRHQCLYTDVELDQMKMVRDEHCHMPSDGPGLRALVASRGHKIVMIILYPSRGPGAGGLHDEWHP